jgi:hypothetical protein
MQCNLFHNSASFIVHVTISYVPRSIYIYIACLAVSVHDIRKNKLRIYGHETHSLLEWRPDFRIPLLRHQRRFNEHLCVHDNAKAH